MIKNFEVGIIKKIETDADNTIQKVYEMGFRVCQISIYNPSHYNDRTLDILQKQCAQYEVEIDGLWAGWPGYLGWNFYEGPRTIGLVPPHLRDERASIIKKGSDFAASLGIKKVITHLGFVPEDMNDDKYTGLIPVLKEIAIHCKKNGQHFLFETGQETPVTLLRTIEDVGQDNVGVNLDPANLLIYGKGNPVDSLDILGHLVLGVHIKDGDYPVDGRNLGKEMPVGEGRVNFPLLLAKLKEYGYFGALCVECELEEKVRLQNIEGAKTLLNNWIKDLG